MLTHYCPASAQPSALSEGSCFKLAISKNGVYKIDYNMLKKMGINPGNINPLNIKIYGNSGGMLPQANSLSRVDDLTENAIFVMGEADGVFNKADFILFYAEGPDQSHFDIDRNIFFYEKNLYADKNFYFFTISESAGKRLTVEADQGTGFPLVQEFDDFIYHELDAHNILSSGREWFGEDFYINSEYIFPLETNGIVDNTKIKVVSDVMSQSKTPSSFKVQFNNVGIGEQFISAIPDTRYGIKGRHKCDTLIFNSSSVSAVGGDSEIKFQFIKSTGSRGYLDYFLVNYKRKLSLYGSQTIFRSYESLQNDVSQFQLDNLTSSALIWDITNPSYPVIQSYSFNNNSGFFSTSTQALKEFIIFTSSPSPEFVGKISQQNLHSLSTPNIIIVTHFDFKDEALRLASHRNSYSGLSAVVVTTDEIYNEFSSGRPDITAIRDFVKHVYDKNPGTLKSLVLFGRSSYDYKNRLPNNTNFVPTYESRNSLHPLETYSSDDFFAFLEVDEGYWGEQPSEEHSLDIGVGRLPVKTIEEAADVVNKIIDYDTNRKSFGRWRKEIVFVADDGDANIHQSQSDQLAKQVEISHPEFNTHRIFLDSYQQVVKPAGEVVPEVNKAIQEVMDRGSLIVNYTGHGGEEIWAEEKIFDNLLIEELDNKNYPLFVTATCEFGRNDDPAIISSAELSVIRKSSGAIGMVTTTRPVSSNTNFELNKAFYETLFVKESNTFLSLGEIFRRTKNTSVSGTSNRNFSLLGDPSLKLALPEYEVVINEIKNTDENSDSLKALSHIIVKGEINTPMGEKDLGFTGTVDAEIFDKEASFITLGDENAPFNYKEWSNAIFRGSASVTNGDFEFEFVVPKNIAYQIGKGKLSLYASHKNIPVDATGSNMNFIVGKSAANPTTDNVSPEIKLYMGDTTFQAGGTITPDSYLVADLNDVSGINISDYGIGNHIVGILDQEEPFILNDYYNASENDYKKGRVVYHMRDLKRGKHSITVKAWDTHNNPAQATIDFIVGGDEIKIDGFGNYPNPFSESTSLFFTHNRPGDDLEGQVLIYDLTGARLKSFDFSVTSSNYKVELQLDSNAFGKKLSEGVYLARLIVRSVSSGSKNEQVTKLFVLN